MDDWQQPRELAALLAASLACVLVLLAGIASGGMLPLSLLGVAAIAGVALIGGGRPARRRRCSG